MTVSSFHHAFHIQKKKATMRIIFPIAVAVILTMAISSIFVAHYSRERNEIENLVGPVCQNWEPPVRAPTCDAMKMLSTALRDENCRVALQSPSSIAAKLTKLADGSPFVFFRGTAAFFYANLFCYVRLFFRIHNDLHLRKSTTQTIG